MASSPLLAVQRGTPSAGMVLALCVSTTVAAFSLTPTSVMLEGSAPQPVKIRVSAPASSSVTLELRVIERHGSKLRERLELPRTAALEVHPPQLFIPPGGTADVTLRWTGPPMTVGSRSFYLVADQLPVAMTQTEAPHGLRFLARLHLPVHVANGGEPELQASATGTGPARRLEIANRGNRYARFAQLKVRVVGSGGANRVIPGPELARLAQADALLPGGSVALAADQLELGPEEQVLGLVERE